MVHIEDGAEVGNECNNSWIELEFHKWHLISVLNEAKQKIHAINIQK